MIRLLCSGFFIGLVTILLAAQAMAGPHLLPRVRLPKINLGKAAAAMTYPVTKSLVNGGKTVFQTAGAADRLGVLPNIGPPRVNNVVKKALWGAGRR